MKSRLLAAYAISSLLLANVLPNCALAAAAVNISWLHRILVTRVERQKEATGIVIGIVQPTGQEIVSYGVSGLHRQTPVSGNTVFGIGSLTKVFTALLLSDMAVHGQISVDTPVEQYLPSAAVTIPSFGGKQITLTDLATQTSGLPLRPSNLVSGWQQEHDLDVRMRTESEEYAGYTVADLYRFLSSYRLEHSPGSHYEYSNVGYSLLGLVLSKHTHTDYADLLHENITAPLGMHDTRLQLTQSMRQRLASGYLLYGGGLIAAPPEKFAIFKGAAGLYSSANDLMKFLSAVLGFKKSRLKPAMDAMLGVRRPGGMVLSNMVPASSQIAFAWNVYTDGHAEVIWKNGSVSGYRAFMGYDPNRRIGVIALANAQSALGVDDIGLHILDNKIRVDTSIPKLYKEITLNTTILDQYVGRYEYSPTDVETILRRGDHLYLHVAGQGNVELFAFRPNEFFLKVLDAQVAFSDLKDGHATKVVWHQSGEFEVGHRTH